MRSQFFRQSSTAPAMNSPAAFAASSSTASSQASSSASLSAPLRQDAVHAAMSRARPAAQTR
eukprot:1504043-Lingulodinium_polyedra.AAC.1